MHNIGTDTTHLLANKKSFAMKITREIMHLFKAGGVFFPLTVSKLKDKLHQSSLHMRGQSPQKVTF